jgi:hypothetical protein
MTGGKSIAAKRRPSLLVVLVGAHTTSATPVGSSEMAAICLPVGKIPVLSSGLKALYRV